MKLYDSLVGLILNCSAGIFDSPCIHTICISHIKCVGGMNWYQNLLMAQCIIITYYLLYLVLRYKSIYIQHSNISIYHIWPQRMRPARGTLKLGPQKSCQGPPGEHSPHFVQVDWRKISPKEDLWSHLDLQLCCRLPDQNYNTQLGILNWSFTKSRYAPEMGICPDFPKHALNLPILVAVIMYIIHTVVQLPYYSECNRTGKYSDRMGQVYTLGKVIYVTQTSVVCIT